MYAILILFSVVSSSWAGHNHFYRRDYTYFEEFDAFYKLHWNEEMVSWNSAFVACDDEGSHLFYPKEEGEWRIVKNLSSVLPEASNTTDVLIGVRDEFGQLGFVTVDGATVPPPVEESETWSQEQSCVIMDIETGSYRRDSCTADEMTARFFVCKKIDEKPCPTIDLEYKYEKDAKKCYKVNNRVKTWRDAWQTCYMEGGMLVTPENSVDQNVLSRLTNNAVHYFVGFRRLYPGSNFYTLKGQKLEDSGFAPNSIVSDTNDANDAKDCGTMYYSSNYGTLYARPEKCFMKLPFICEIAARA